MEDKIEVLYHYNKDLGDHWVVNYNRQNKGFIWLGQNNGEKDLFFNPTESSYNLEELDAIREAFDKLPYFPLEDE